MTVNIKRCGHPELVSGSNVERSHPVECPAKLSHKHGKDLKSSSHPEFIFSQAVP